MNSIIEIKETDDQKVYFTSDTHFNHNRSFIYESRGYTDVQSYTTAVIDKINERVRATDILFHLGDFSLNTERDGLNELLSRLVCQNIYYIWGNHNSPLWTLYQDEIKDKIYYKGYTSKIYNVYTQQYEVGGVPCELPVTYSEIYPLRYRNLIFIGNYAEVIVNGHKFVMSHYPILVFNYMAKGAKHLCGHSHGRLDFSDENNLTSKVLDVGWDDNKRPLSLPEVLKIMNRKSIFVSGDHHAPIEENYEKAK